MEAVVHLDTHVVIWLYAGCTEQLSDHVKSLIEENTLTISPMVILELSYLKETNRLNIAPHTMVNDLHDRIGLIVDATPMSLVVDQAVSLSWTRDPFDRLITAQAACYEQKLITKDEFIRNNYANAEW